MTKEITLNDLARMVNEGFNNVEKRFDRLEKEIKEIRAEIEDIKSTLSKVAFRHELKELEFRIEKLEEKLA